MIEALYKQPQGLSHSYGHNVTFMVMHSLSSLYKWVLQVILDNCDTYKLNLHGRPGAGKMPLNLISSMIFLSSLRVGVRVVILNQNESSSNLKIYIVFHWTNSNNILVSRTRNQSRSEFSLVSSSDYLTSPI